MGHIITKERIKPDPRKIEVITQWKNIETAEIVYEFYRNQRRYIRYYVKKIYPLYDIILETNKKLKDKNNKWYMGYKDLQCFRKLKE